MRDHNQQPLVDAVLYADIFDFALSEKELFKYSIGKCTKSDLNYFLSFPPGFITLNKGYICLKDRGKLIDLRIKKDKISILKKQKAGKIAKLIGKIPTVQLVGLSGALAVNNAEEDDDIDLFIVTNENTIWKTRLLITILLKLLGKNRSKNNINTRDKICLNMFMTTDSLALGPERQDLYTAHEIAQLTPLVNKNKTYSHFIQANIWVKNFLPNALPDTSLIKVQKPKKNLLKLTEKISKMMQLWYMQKSRTIEIVKDDFLAFHPIDYRSLTLNEFKNRKKKYEAI